MQTNLSQRIRKDTGATHYSARLEKSSVYLYSGEKKVARFYKGQDLAGRCAALLNGMDLIPNCPELDAFLNGRLVPDWIMFRMWKTVKDILVTTEEPDKYCECNNPIQLTKPHDTWLCDKCELPIP